MLNSELSESIDENPWIEYQWDDEGTRPISPGKFEVYRPSCDKQHYCQWNGSGWSSENNTIKYYRKIVGPII